MIMRVKNSNEKLSSKLQTSPKQNSQKLTGLKQGYNLPHPNISSFASPSVKISQESSYKTHIQNSKWNSYPINKRSSIPKSDSKSTASNQSLPKHFQSPKKLALPSKIQEQQTSLYHLTQKQSNQQHPKIGSVKTANSQNYQPQHRLQEQEQEFKCPICYQEHPLTSKLRFNESCPHFFCQLCIQSQIKYRIKSNKLIKCLQATCDQTMDQKSTLFHKLTTTQQKQYRKILKIHFPKTLNKCPCCGEFLHRNKSECIKCGIGICPICMQLQHQGDCNTHFEKISYYEIKASYNLLRCSRCRRYISKDGGCSHISCVCGHYFCQICGETLTGNHRCKPIKPAPKLRPPRNQTTKKQQKSSTENPGYANQQRLINSSNRPVIQAQPARVEEVRNSGLPYICNNIRTSPAICLLLFWTIPCDIMGFLLLLSAFALGFCIVVVVALFYYPIKSMIRSCEGEQGLKYVACISVLLVGLPIAIFVYWLVGIACYTHDYLLPTLDPFLQIMFSLPCTTRSIQAIRQF